MTKRGRSFWGAWQLAIVMILVPIVVGALVWFMSIDKNVAVLNPQGQIAAQEKDLIVFTLVLSAVVVLPVFAMLGIFAWKYRETNQKAAYTPDVEGNRWLEALWWGIPIIIIGILSVITWVTTHQLDPYKPLDSNVKPLKVQVVALQWKWLFIYPEYDMASVNELRIPDKTPINFEITADAPMSAFWIPNLGGQVYAMTGMTAKLSLMADRPGVYRGSNSNINGTGYSAMAFNAVTVPAAEFAEWSKKTVIENDKLGMHFDWSTYEKLAKPSQGDKIGYYHLHDHDLYTKIINKFAHGHSAQKEEGHSH